MSSSRQVRENRDTLNVNISSYDKNTGALLGHVLDISPGGLSIFARGLPITPKELDIELDLPWEVDGYNKIKLHAKRCWIKLQSGRRWRAGFQVFEDKDENGLWQRIISSPQFQAAL